MIEKNQKKVAIIQARMGSSRLPGKVMKNIAGKPMLAYVCERIGLSNLINQIVVATTDEPSDDPIAIFCEENNTPYFRGKQFDVLDRYYQASLFFKADIIVRITADCPLVDPVMIDDVIQSYVNQKVDFAANRLPPPGHVLFRLDWILKFVLLRLLKRHGKKLCWNLSENMSCPLYMTIQIGLKPC